MAEYVEDLLYWIALDFIGVPKNVYIEHTFVRIVGCAKY